MKDRDKSSFILEGSIYKVLFMLSVPIMINSLIQTLYNLADAYFVGKISYVHFAATSFVWPINFLFVSIGMGVSIAGTSLISKRLGAERYDDAREYSNQLIVISLLMSLIFALIGYITSPVIIKAMGGEGDIFKYGTIYLRITFLDLPFMFLYFAINAILTSQGDTVTPTVLSGISAALNVILDPIFIFNLNMGIGGAAWATLLARAVLAVTGMIYLLKGNSRIKPSLRGFKLNKNILSDIYRVGLPISTGQTGTSLGFMVLNGFIVSYGTATLAAFGMVNRVTGLLVQPAMGVGAALTAIIGQNLGADREDRADEAYRKASIIASAMGIIGCIIIFLFNDSIVKFFISGDDDPEVIIQSLTYMKYVGISMPFMGMFSVYQGIFQGSGATKYSMIMEILRLWVFRLPVILIFKNYFDIGSTGIWIAMSFSNLAVCIYGYIMFRKHGWRQRELRAA